MSAAPILHLSEIAAAIAGARVVGAHVVDAADVGVTRVCTDSRAIEAGDLFIALRGERFDAHRFLADVAGRGAAAAMVDTLDPGCALPQVLVPDTRAGLGLLAAAWRRRFAIPVVAVTGSNGKTTVKEMIAAIFAAAVGQDARLATAGNFNNDIGLPLTLLGLRERHRLAVIELGMNHPGETATLARIAAPTVGLINNAQREHQEFMHGVEAVAQEHGTLISNLAPTAAAVFPADDPYAPLWRELAGARRVVDFAPEGDVPAAVTGRWQTMDGGLAIDVTTPAGDFAVFVSAFGAHNARNALAATAAAVAAGVDLDAIRAGLAAFRPVKGRLQARRIAAGLLVDDTYNANPDSVRAAIDVLAAMPATRILILGDMGEVGDQGAQFHAEVGAYAKASGIEMLLAVGPLSSQACEAFGAGAVHYTDVDTLIAALPGSMPRANASVLVKGSRFMRMERVVDSLSKESSCS